MFKARFGEKKIVVDFWKWICGEEARIPPTWGKGCTELDFLCVKIRSKARRLSDKGKKYEFDSAITFQLKYFEKAKVRIRAQERGEENRANSECGTVMSARSDGTLTNLSRTLEN
jgi:hypothetical protein